MTFNNLYQLCNTREKCKNVFVSTLAVLYLFFVHIPVSETVFIDFRIIIALFLFLFLYSDFKKINFNNLSVPILLLISIFFIYIFLTMSWSLNLDYGSFRILGLLFDIIPTILLSVVLFNNPKYLKYEIIILVTQIIGLTLVILIIAQGGLNFNNISENLLSFGHIGYGRFLGFAFILGTFALLKSNKNYSILLFTNSLIFFGLFLSGHRASLLGAILFSIVLLISRLFLSKPFYKKTIAKYFVLIATSLILTLLFTNKFPTSLIRNKSLLISKIDDIKSDGSFNARLLLYDYSFNTIKKNPFTGVGLGGFNSKTVLNEHKKLKYSHNIFLDILTEQGIVGFVLFASILLILLVKLPKVMIYWIILLYGIWLSLFYGVLHDHKLIFIFFYFVVTKKSYLGRGIE